MRVFRIAGWLLVAIAMSRLLGNWEGVVLMVGAILVVEGIVW